MINRDIVTFGHWEQDNDFDDGPEPLEWLVLERDAETVKLISLNVLRQEPFHDEYGRVTWETCSLRPWLNGEFMEQAFTPWEQEQLVLTTVTADANPEYGTDAGNDTQDRVWLMSAKEALTYFDTDAERIACPTEWGVNHGCRPSGDAGACFWVLRTPGRNQENISAVNWDGEVSCDSDYAVYSGFTIRPMIAVRLRDGEMPVQTEEEALAEAAMPEAEEAPEAEEVPYEIEDEDYSYVTAADGSLYVKPMLFAVGEPAAAALDRPAPADGTRYLALRLDMMDGMLEETEIRAAMNSLTLYGLSDHSTLTPVDIDLARMPGETWVRAFDLIYQDDGARPREDYALLADEALYPLAQLPGEGTTLRLAYAAELSGMGEYLLDDVLNALNDPIYRTTYDSLLTGEVVQKGSKGDAAKGVQRTLAAFGQDIAVDGNVGPKSIAALNAVQTAFGLTPTESLDAVGYAELLPRLLLVTNPDEADALLMGSKDYGEYDYMCACALAVQGKYASAKDMFEQSQWGDWEARAAACVQPWPKNGVLYKNPDVKGSSTELTVKFNTEPDTAMLVKIYTADGVLARTMFIGGTGKATCQPARGHLHHQGRHRQKLVRRGGGLRQRGQLRDHDLRRRRTGSAAQEELRLHHHRERPGLQPRRPGHRLRLGELGRFLSKPNNAPSGLARWALLVCPAPRMVAGWPISGFCARGRARKFAPDDTNFLTGWYRFPVEIAAILWEPHARHSRHVIETGTIRNLSVRFQSVLSLA